MDHQPKSHNIRVGYFQEYNVTVEGGNVSYPQCEAYQAKC